MSDTCVDTGRLEAILARHAEGDAAALVDALRDLQAAFRHVPVAGVAAVCRHLRVPLSRAFSVATFHRAFALSPKGEIVFKVCTGPACHVRGAAALVTELCEKLALRPGETTKDLKFTVEAVACVGACAMAPVVLVNGEARGGVKEGDLVKVVDKVRA